MKRRSFVPRVSRISPQEVGSIPELEAVISYWNRNLWSPEEWLRRTAEEWGSTGLVSSRGEKVLGFCVFGPRRFFPRANEMSVDLSDRATVFLAYAGGDRRTKKHLLVRMLKNLRERGVPAVEALASDLRAKKHVSTRFLSNSGWQPVNRIYYRGFTYTLMRAELDATVEIGDLARGIIGRVRLPGLKDASPVPGALKTAEPPRLQSGSTAVLTEEMPSGVDA